jgi:dynein intermediate chain 2
VNTLRAEYMSQGMNHFEGGWPKDINPAEHDQTMRFRKKIEKDDSYINSVLGLCQVS